jgi:hypothetical protein
MFDMESIMKKSWRPLYEGRTQQTGNLMCGKVSSNYIAKILGVLDTYI